jgi:hypothetical protein
MILGPDGCHYDTEWEARAIGVLGMCGCGEPERAYNFLRDILKLCDRRASDCCVRCATIVARVTVASVAQRPAGHATGAPTKVLRDPGVADSCIQAAPP